VADNAAGLSGATTRCVSDAETVPVTVTVIGLQRLTGAGRLLALAAVDLLIDGVSIAVRGIRIERTGPHELTVKSPTFRGGAGAAEPAVLLPEELGCAITDAVLAEYKRAG
jgi:stage V sporulation protein G